MTDRPDHDGDRAETPPERSENTVDEKDMIDVDIRKSPFRGLVFALPISVLVWGVVIVGIPALVNWYAGLLR